MKLKQSLLSAFLIIFSIIIYHDAIALSCKPMADRIIAQCKNLNCDKIIYISEIKSFDRCSRRPRIINPPPKWAKSVLEYEIKSRGISTNQGLYELTINKRLFNRNFLFSNTQEYIEASENKDIPNK